MTEKPTLLPVPEFAALREEYLVSMVPAANAVIERLIPEMKRIAGSVTEIVDYQSSIAAPAVWTVVAEHVARSGWKLQKHGPSYRLSRNTEDPYGR